MQEIISNKEIVSRLMKKAGVDNFNQYAKYLSQKYGLRIKRQNIHQFLNSDRLTLTHLLLREALQD